MKHCDKLLKTVLLIIYSVHHVHEILYSGKNSFHRMSLPVNMIFNVSSCISDKFCGLVTCLCKGQDVLYSYLIIIHVQLLLEYCRYSNVAIFFIFDLMKAKCMLESLKYCDLSFVNVLEL